MEQLDPVDAHDVGEIARERRSRNLRRGGLVLAGIAIAGVAAFVVMNQLDKKANERVDASWSRLSRCLVGDPLGPGEAASVRMRKVQLAALTLSPQQRAEGETGVPWPQRCGALAHAVSEALHDAGRAGEDDKSLAALAEQLGKQLTDTNAQDPLTRDYRAALDALYARAAEEKVVARPGADGPAPPGNPAAPFTLDTLASVTPMSTKVFNLQNIMAESHASREAHLLIEDKTDSAAPWDLCTIDDKTIKCRKLPAQIVATKSGLRLLGTTDDGAPPLVFAGNRGADGVFRSDTGERVAKMYSYGGYVSKDGFAAVLGWDDDKQEVHLARQTTGAAPKTVVVKPDVRIGNAFYGSMLLWNRLVLRGVDKKEQRRLYAQPIDHGEKPAKDMKDVGGLPEAGLIEAGEDEPHISGCRTAEATAVRVKGYANEFVAFDIGGTWREPIGSRAQGGSLTCRKAEATITRIDSFGVTQNRCTTAGCKRAYVELEKIMPTKGELAPRSGYLQAIDVDGELLVVWAAGESGGLRYRFAPIERIAQAPDVVVYDDLVEGGKVGTLSTLFGIGLLAREGYAVIVLATKNGIVALRVTPDGKVAPAPAQRG
ncbi:MAG TPA: hypothetical protein VHB21_03020 [Minicystis sp.]|nr:hypothetical protein [Minicystis sp.]